MFNFNKLFHKLQNNLNNSKPNKTNMYQILSHKNKFSFKNNKNNDNKQIN
jgi:hypothetical protein